MTEKDGSSSGDDGGELISAARLAEARLEKLRQQTEEAREGLRKSTAELAEKDSAGELISHKHLAKAQLKKLHHSLEEDRRQTEADRAEVLEQMIKWLTIICEIPENIRELENAGVEQDELEEFRQKYGDYQEEIFKDIEGWPELIRGFDRAIQGLAQIRQDVQSMLDNFPEQ